MNLRHGYARWQYIVEDKDVGLAEIVRQELNLPGMNGPFVGAGNPATDNASTGHSINVCATSLKLAELILIT